VAAGPYAASGSLRLRVAPQVPFEIASGEDRVQSHVIDVGYQLSTLPIRIRFTAQSVGKTILPALQRFVKDN
jgi:hypothetical protein